MRNGNGTVRPRRRSSSAGGSGEGEGAVIDDDFQYTVADTQTDGDDARGQIIEVRLLLLRLFIYSSWSPNQKWKHESADWLPERRNATLIE